MKTFLKILIAIIVVVAIAFGIYCVLPETQKMFIKGNIQYRTDDEAKEKIDILKANTISYTETADNGVSQVVDTGVTYGDALEKACKTTAWYYEKTADGSITITFYGSKASLDLAKYNVEGIYVNQTIKVVFSFPANDKSTVSIYLEDELLSGEKRTAALKALANQ